MTEDILERLASEYALGVLDEDEHALSVRLEQHDPAFAARVDEWRRRMAELDATAAAVEPSPVLWQRIDSGLAAVPAGGRSRPRRTSGRTRAWPDLLAGLWRDLGVWRGIGMSASAAALVMAVGLALLMRENARTPVLVAVLLSGENRPAAVVNAFRDGRTELIPLEAIAAPAGKALQVWTLWDRERGPVSVGLLDAMRSLELTVNGLPQTGPDQLFEVTLEPAGGSPTGRPTGPILMKGNTTRAL